MGTAKNFHCGECEKSFGNKGHLNRHMRTHTGERPYKCTECPKSFMRKDHLDDHSFTHTMHRPFPCTRCDKKFYTKQKLENHEALHDRPKPHVCKFCNQAFVKKNQLARHCAEHTGQMPFPCSEPECEKAFASPSALKRHQEQRHSLSTYVCLESGCQAEPFTKFSQLQRHLKLHRSKQNHECDRCGKRFRNASSLNKHKPTHEQPVADRLTYRCQFPGCQAAYTSSGNLGTHVRSKHLNRDAFVCEFCNDRFSVKSSYQRHIRNLHGPNGKIQDFRFCCILCSTSFSSRAALRRHMRVVHKKALVQTQGAENGTNQDPGDSSVSCKSNRSTGSPTIDAASRDSGRSFASESSPMNTLHGGTAGFRPELNSEVERKRRRESSLEEQYWEQEPKQRDTGQQSGGESLGESQLKRHRMTTASSAKPTANSPHSSVIPVDVDDVPKLNGSHEQSVFAWPHNVRGH